MQAPGHFEPDWSEIRRGRGRREIATARSTLHQLRWRTGSGAVTARLVNARDALSQHWQYDEDFVTGWATATATRSRQSLAREPGSAVGCEDTMVASAINGAPSAPSRPTVTAPGDTIVGDVGHGDLLVAGRLISLHRVRRTPDYYQTGGPAADRQFRPAAMCSDGASSGPRMGLHQIRGPRAGACAHSHGEDAVRGILNLACGPPPPARSVAGHPSDQLGGGSE